MPNHIFQNDIIPITQAFLKRTHIHTLLEKAIQKPVTTVVAGAGYGKTQAVYAFLQDYDAVTIWLQLSTFDNLPYRLWENFIYTFSTQNKKLATDLMSLGFPETMAAYERWLEFISDAIKQDQRYIFVFDDFQLIIEKNVIDFFNRLFNSRVPNLSFILISRSEPQINRIGLLSKDLISTIDEDDLRFTKNEIVDYFKLKDIQLPPKTVTEIHRYTDGWIFAINLVALSLIKDSDHDNYALSLAKENITKLIETEFSFLSRNLQGFLVKLSLLDNLPLDLLKELSSSDTSLILEMAKVSSFIRYDAFINTYRIHHMFLDFLHKKQAVLGLHDKKEIYMNAAAWYAKNGYTTDAITYYEKAGCYDELINIGLSFPRPCPKETAEFLIELLKKAPKTLSDKKPFIGLLHASLLLNNFRAEEAYTEYMQLREKYEAFPPSDQNREILGEIYIALGFLGYFAYMYNNEVDDFKEFFKLAEEMLPSGSKIFKTLHINTGHYACSIAGRDKGEFEKHNNLLKYMIPYMSKVMHGCAYGLEYLALAETNYFRRNFANAEKFAYQAIYMAQEKQQYDIENMAVFYLMRIYTAKGQYKKISSLLEQIQLLVEKYNYSEAFKQHDIIEGWFYSTVGQTQKVAAWITHDLEDSADNSPITFCMDRLVSAKCYLTEKKYEKLLVLIEQRNHNFSIENYLLGSIEMGLMKAVALYHTHKRKEALVALEDAYELAHPNDLIMPFIEMGDNMHTLTRMAMREGNCKIPMNWLQMINTKSSTYAKKLACMITDYQISKDFIADKQIHLTKRETEILTDLCHGLTRKEIADNCNLSMSTVKLILQIIFEKLDAANTTDAVRIATLMNLVE